MTGDTSDNDLTDELIALIAEETQSLSGLVAVFVQRLVAVVRDSRVWAGVIFYCYEQKETQFVLKVQERTSLTGKST